MSIYKRSPNNDLFDPAALSPLQHRMALAHAYSIELSNSSLGFDIHNFDSCPACDAYGANFRAVVVQNLEVKTHAC